MIERRRSSRARIILALIIIPTLVGGYLVYGSVGEGKESAEGQITVAELTEIYKILNR